MIIAVPASEAIAAGTQAAPDLLQIDLRQAAWQLGSEKRWVEAEKIWLEVLDHRSDDGDAASELGDVYAAQNKHGKAAEMFERALQFRAEPVPTRLRLGKALNAANKHSEARIVFNDVLAKEADHIEAITGLSRSLLGLGKHESALATAQRAVDLLPADAEALMTKGAALKALNRADEAIASVREALRVAPDHLGAAIALADLLKENGQAEEAAVLLNAREHAAGDNADFLVALGATLLATRRYVEACDIYRRLVSLKPATAGHYVNHALGLMGQDRYQDAVTACLQALAIEPNSAIAQFNLGCIHLANGNYSQGWDGYEYRFGDKPAARPDLRAAPWCGESLAGKSIMVLGEQANGDYLQFVRYLLPLIGFGAQVFFHGPKRLQRIISSVSSEISFVDALNVELGYDYQCHLMSLPRRLHGMGLPIPTAPYLHSEPAPSERWKTQIGSDGLRIGIAWQGSLYDRKPSDRAFALEHMRPLAEVPGVRLISLQMGKGAEQIEALSKTMRIETLGAAFDTGPDGFIDTAAVMDNLDLIITCDTSLAHLAGGLGRPVWIALNEAPEWRWQRDRSDTVWYPSARLFRQKTRGDWHGVFTEMAAALREFGSAADQPVKQPKSAPHVAVSWGEIVDKISILEIKAAKAVSPETRNNVEFELAELNTALFGLGEQNAALTALRAQLRDVNETLWDVEDALRAHEAERRFDETFIELARSVYQHNDRRAEIKRAVNTLTNSNIVEEKLYRAY